MFDLSPLEYRIAELERRLSNVVRPGTISEADYSQARVKVKLGENVTAWLPWITRRAGSAVEWWAPEVDEQVLVLSPGGELAQGIVLPSLYSSAHPAPSDDEKIRSVVFGDGSSVEYDENSHSLTVTVSGGDVSITADGGNLTLNGDDNDGVVCKNHACAFTGSPHPQGSETVKAGG